MGPLVWTLAVVLGIGTTHAQLTEPGGRCCGVNLMDSSNRPVIENTPLDVGTISVTYRALRIHLCCTDRTFVQIWRRLYTPTDLPKRRYQLVWQMPIEARMYMITSSKYAVFEFDAPLTLSSISGQKEYHLGLWSPGNDKHCVPYKFLQSQTRMIFPSLERFNDPFSLFADLELGTTAEFDELDFPRSHMDSLDFCENIMCNDVLDEDQNPSDEHVAAGAPGPPGPPGPPGAAFPTANPDFPFGCDIGDSMNADMTEIKRQNDDIKKELDKVNSQINDLMHANVVTGTCMNGFRPGTYGIGSCYYFSQLRMSYGEASISCADNYDSRLLNIETLTEEVFLRRYIATSLGDTPENEVLYFLGAMFAPRQQRWYWYDDSSGARSDFLEYNNWPEGYSKQQLREDHTYCLALAVNLQSDTSYWKPVSCMEELYSICKRPKQCM